MVTTLSELANGLISFRAFLTLMAAGVLFVWRRPNDRWPRVWLAVVLSVYVLLAIPLVPYAGERVLAGRYEPFAPSAGPDIGAIVLLGAGAETVQGLEQQLGLLSTGGASRTLEAARVYRLLHEPWLISSGGTRNTSLHQETSAVTMQTALVHLGVRPDRIVVEERSTTTREEAVLIAPMLRQLRAERFVLVTTRSHMPRSEAVFRAQGLDPIPAVVPDTIELERWPRFLAPDVSGLKWSDALFHELVGLLYYRWRGWL